MDKAELEIGFGDFEEDARFGNDGPHNKRVDSDIRRLMDSAAPVRRGGSGRKEALTTPLRSRRSTWSSGMNLIGDQKSFGQ
jgi:hypothetical protein